MSGENQQAEEITDITLGEDGVFRAEAASEQGEAEGGGTVEGQHESPGDAASADIDQAALAAEPARKRGVFPILALGSLAAAIGVGLFYYGNQSRLPFGGNVPEVAADTAGGGAEVVTTSTSTGTSATGVSVLEVPKTPEISLDKVTEAVGGAAKSAADAVGALAEDGAETVSGIAEGAAVAAGEAGTAMTEVASGAAESISNAVENIAQGAGEAVSGAVDAASSAEFGSPTVTLVEAADGSMSAVAVGDDTPQTVAGAADSSITSITDTVTAAAGTAIATAVSPTGDPVNSEELNALRSQVSALQAELASLKAREADQSAAQAKLETKTSAIAALSAIDLASPTGFTDQLDTLASLSGVEPGAGLRSLAAGELPAIGELQESFLPAARQAIRAEQIARARLTENRFERVWNTLTAQLVFIPDDPAEIEVGSIEEALNTLRGAIATMDGAALKSAEARLPEAAKQAPLMQSWLHDAAARIGAEHELEVMRQSILKQ